MQTGHKISSSVADNIQQWFNAGGMIQFYDYPLQSYLNVGLLTLLERLVADIHVRRLLTSLRMGPFHSLPFNHT